MASLRIAITLSLCLGVLSSSAHSADRPPNIIFILADDLGWADVGCYGNRFNQTPHVDELAKTGMRFTDAYAAAPVCSPYRASLLTGQAPARTGILDYLRPNSGRALADSHITIAEMLKRAGYTTGMIGKWHLTGYKHHGAPSESRPTAHGFDTEIGAEVKGVGNGANTWPYVFRDQPIRWLDIKDNKLGKDEYLTDRLNYEAVQFIEKNHQKPFFLYLSHYAIHSILNGRADKVAKYRKLHPPGKSGRDNCYICKDAGLQGDAGNHWAVDHNPHLAAMLESIDDGVGKIVAKLEELGLREDTLIVFTSDNGGESHVTSNMPQRGGKSQLYEGGIRIPLVVSWPAKMAKGKVSSVPTVNTDFYPTFLDAVGIKPDPKQTLDGVSMLPTLLDPRKAPVRDTFYWHYPLNAPHFLGGFSGGAIRDGDWKLIEFYTENRVELYSLADDPSETTDLAKKQPERVTKLREKLSKWREEVGANIPSEPVMAKPGGLIFEDSFTPGQVSERWFFQETWDLADGRLVRNEIAGENKRIFYKKPLYRDCVIQFDFCFRGTDEIRLMTGTPGKYNAVVEIHPEYFQVNSASDSTVPFFPRYHGACKQGFVRDRWCTMTVEITKDEIIAHTDRDHFVLGQHPILDRQRDYFAFQVGQAGAAFDNVRVFNAKQRKEWAEMRGTYQERLSARQPISRAPEERLKLVEIHTRDRLYRTDSKYRALVAEVDRQKELQHERFPDVFSSVKQAQKKTLEKRKQAQANDPRYKHLLKAIHLAQREEREFLFARRPDLKDLPSNRAAADLERLRVSLKKNAEFQRILQKQAMAEEALEDAYSEFFVTNAQIQEKHRAARKVRNSDDAFRAQLKATSSAVQAVKAYELQAEPRIVELKKQLED